MTLWNNLLSELCSLWGLRSSQVSLCWIFISISYCFFYLFIFYFDRLAAFCIKLLIQYNKNSKFNIEHFENFSISKMFRTKEFALSFLEYATRILMKLFIACPIHYFIVHFTLVRWGQVVGGEGKGSLCKCCCLICWTYFTKGHVLLKSVLQLSVNF